MERESGFIDNKQIHNAVSSRDSVVWEDKAGGSMAVKRQDI